MGKKFKRLFGTCPLSVSLRVPLKDYLVPYRMEFIAATIMHSVTIRLKHPIFVIRKPEKNTELNSVITCAFTNVVYLIRCSLGYVGKTSRQLKQRISEFFQKILLPCSGSFSVFES